MSERSGYKSGVPCWVDLSSTDVTLSVRFYREIFGWEAVFDPRPESGGYGRFTSNGHAVAGIGPSCGDGVPSIWNTYMATDDVGIMAARVREAGGTVVMEPVGVLDEGVTAAFQDPAGALFMAWQAGRHRGAEITDEPGALTWNELVTWDAAACRAFYPAVFGWDAEDGGTGAGTGEAAWSTRYTEWRVDGHAVAGMAEPGPRFPPGTPPHWLACFAVEDTGTTVARAEELGGIVLVPRTRTPRGSMAVLADPQLAVFAVAGPDGLPG
ncbi:VOC family protein [Streptosporangium sp. CA-135522]|uniref:VOC family protein n=1 Tax=Streptosporangium sp. CA-135522 TaxID=3240072 RepID=UPI003D925CA2